MSKNMLLKTRMKKNNKII